MVNVIVLHAGIGHPSPFFYNFNKEFEKFRDINLIIQPELPRLSPEKNSLLYFHRLKRFYNSNNIQSVNDFIIRVKRLKNLGWKIAWTIHNFYPIDRNINEIDEYLLKEFMKIPDIIFTFSKLMSNTVKVKYNRNSVIHSFGFNKLDGWFNKKEFSLNLPKNSFLFSCVGNIVEYKNYEYVIESFKRIRNKNVYLLIAGLESKYYKLNKKVYINDKNIILIHKFIGDFGWQWIAKNSNVIINMYNINSPAFRNGFFPSNCIQIVKYKKISISPKCREIEELIPNKYIIDFDYNKKNSLYGAMKYSIENRIKLNELEKMYPNIDYNWENVVGIVVENIQKLF